MSTSNLLRILVVLSLCLPHALSAADTAGLVVRLSLPGTKLCLGQASLPLEAIITNNSDEAIEISTDGVGGGVVLYKLPLIGTPRQRSVKREVEPNRWVQILPRHSISVPFNNSLSPKDPNLGGLLESAGNFAIQIQFAVFTRSAGMRSTFRGSILSNKVAFSLSKCPIPLEHK